MKKFITFIAGFVTASALSLVIIYRLIRFITEILARLDALDTLKKGFLIFLGKALGLREFEFKPRRRPPYCDHRYAYARYSRERKEEQDES